MKLGIMVETQDGLTWDRWRRLVRAAEELGFESIWLSDHFLSPHGPDRESLDPWLALAVAATESTRLRFGPLVSPVTFRHPSLLAKMAASLDLLSGGRLVLGVGAGWNDQEHRIFGIPFPPVGERMDMFEESLQVLRLLLGEGPAHFEGRFYQLDGADPLPKPAQRPRLPLLIGGMGEQRTLRLVARYADEWNLTSVAQAVYRAKRERLLEHCREVGRDPAEIHHSMATGFLIGRDAAELERRARSLRELVPSLSSLAVSEVLDVARAWGWTVGTPDQIVEHLAALGREGIERVMLELPDQTDIQALEIIASDVLPVVAG